MTSFLSMWCYQCDASCNIAVFVFADGLCRVYHNGKSVKIITKQHSFHLWKSAYHCYLLAELDLLFRFDCLLRGEVWSILSEYLRHERLSDLPPPAAFPFRDAKNRAVLYHRPQWPRKHVQRLRVEEGLLTVWGEREMRVQRARGGFTLAAEYKGTSAKAVSPDLSTLTAVTEGSRTPTQEAKTNLKTYTNSALKCETLFKVYCISHLALIIKWCLSPLV